MIGDPATAPERADLTFLRRRSRPRRTSGSTAASSPATSSQGASRSSPDGGGRIDYTRPGRTPAASTSAPTSSSGSLDLSGASSGGIDYRRPDRESRQPAPSGSLDLSSPDAAPARPGATPPAPSSSSLDLSEQGPARGSAQGPAQGTAPSGGAGSLDLSARPAATPARAPAAPSRPERRDRHLVRVHGRRQQLLSVQDPTVTLTRAQSGIGQLMVEAVCSPEIGDLRLGAAYQLRSGGSGTVQHADGSRFAPSSRRPVIAGSREEYERLGIDLRQVGDIERIAVYAYSESRTELTWGGTLVVTLFGGARLELPLETLYAGRLAVLMSFYNVDGQLVVRAEMETIAGDVREAARAYGYDRITWRDERSPVD